MMATRQEVYAAIDGERDYQDQVWQESGNNGPNKLSTGDFILLIEEYAARARKAFCSEAYPERGAHDHIRKIAGIAVNCMEQHGVVERKR
jgi:hypothetical protein